MAIRFGSQAVKDRLVPRILAVLMMLSMSLDICLAQSNSGTLFGRVRDEAGNALEGALIKLANEQTGNERSVLTNGEGYFTIPNLRAGRYRIVASKEGFIPQPFESFPIQITVKNEIKLPDIKLKRGRAQGKVTDAEDKALMGAIVSIHGVSLNMSGTAMTGYSGHYTFEGLPPGSYIITAEWKGGASHGRASIPFKLDQAEVYLPTIKLKEVLRTSANAQAQSQTTNETKSGVEAAGLVNTVDAARVSSFDERQLNSLPLGANAPQRSFDELAVLVTGVVPAPYTPGVRGPGVGYGIGTPGQFSVNGMRARSNNFSVDGSDNNDPDVGVRRQGFVALVPQSIESVKNFSIATLLWDAELGRNFGSQVNAVSDYGGNAFHGKLYVFFTDSRLNARNFFDLTGGPSGGEDPFTRSQFGFTLGGPIVRNRTQFFMSYERQQVNASLEQNFSTPTSVERSFEREFLVQTFVRIFGPFTDVTPLGGNILSFYPLPNNPRGPYGANTLTRILPASGRGDVFSLMLSHQFTPDNLFSARYNFTDDERTLPSANRAINSTLNSATRSHNLSLVLDSMLSPRLFNQARFSFGRTRLNIDAYPGNPYLFSASSSQRVAIPSESCAVICPFVTTLNSETGLIGELVVEPFSPVGIGVYNFPQRRASNTFQYADTLSLSAGAHSIKFGGNIRRYQLNSVMDRLYRPQVVYSGGISGDSSDFEFVPAVRQATLGPASAILQTITKDLPNSTIGLRFTEYHFFINDNWRVTPRLTIDLGLRYEYNTVPTEVNNRIEDAIQLKNITPPGSSILDIPAATEAFNRVANAYRGILDGRERIYEDDRNNFGPRAGFAWSLDSAGRTVLRAGYGVYFDTILGAVVSQSRNVFPNEIPLQYDNSIFRSDAFFNLLPPVAVFPSGISIVRGGSCNNFGTCNQVGGGPQDFVAVLGNLFISTSRTGGLTFTLPDKRMRTPYAQQWQVTFERELFGNLLLSAAYVGTKGTKLTRLTTPNLGPNVTTLTNAVTRQLNGFPVAQPVSIFALPFGCDPISPCTNILGRTFLNRPIPALGAYQIFENSASSNYHALQVEARNRLSRGFQFTAAYTWSHAIDDVSDLFTIGGAPVLPQDSLDLKAERAVANFDIRHRFAGSFIWDMPYFSKASGVAGFLLSDWQVASIFQAQTGQPFTLNVPFDTNFDGNLTDRPSTTDGLIFFSEHGPERVRIAPGFQISNFLTQTPAVTVVVGGAPITKFRIQNGQVGRNTARGDGLINLDMAFSKRFRFTETQVLTFRTEIFNLLDRANFGLPVRIIGAPGFGRAVDTVTPARLIQFGLKYDF